MNDDFEALQGALQQAWKRYQKALGADSRAELEQLCDAGFRQVEEHDPLIPECDIGRVILMSDPMLHRLREKPPAGFPGQVRTDAGVRYYSAKDLQGWLDMRVAEAMRIIEPDLQAPLTLSPQTRIFRNGILKAPETAEEISEAIVEAVMAAMAREVEIYFERERMDSAKQRQSVERLRAAMIKAKRELEHMELPRQFRRQMELKENFTPQYVALVIKRCDERLQKPARSGPSSDAFEQEIAGKWACELLRLFGREQKIAKTRGGDCAKLAAILYGDPDADLSRYCSGRASANPP